jgi:hypothetical protein
MPDIGYGNRRLEAGDRIRDAGYEIRDARFEILNRTNQTSDFE